MKVELTSFAEFRLTSILTYLEKQWTKKISAKYLEEIDATIQLISDYPEMFPAYKEDSTLRKATISKHNSIIYEIRENIVYILTFADNRQDDRTVLQELKKYNS